MVHGQGLESLGGKFIGVGFCWGLVRLNRCHPKRIASKLAI